MDVHAESWNTYQKLVLSELERLNKSVELLNEKMMVNRQEIEVIKVKSGVFGSISAIIVVIITTIFEYFRRS